MNILDDIIEKNKKEIIILFSLLLSFIFTEDYIIQFITTDSVNKLLGKIYTHTNEFCFIFIMILFYNYRNIYIFEKKINEKRICVIVLYLFYYFYTFIIKDYFTFGNIIIFHNTPFELKTYSISCLPILFLPILLELFNLLFKDVYKKK